MEFQSNFSIATHAVAGHAVGVLPLLAALGRAPNNPPSSMLAPPAAELEAARGIGAQGWVIPHEQTFAAIYQMISRVYYSRFDEALRDSQKNSLEMLNDPLIDSLIQERIEPVIGLPLSLESEEKDDPDQKEVVHQIDQTIKSIPRFHNIKRALAWSRWYGKTGVNMKMGRKWAAGDQKLIPVSHKPVHGDKILFGFAEDTDVPGILVHQNWASRQYGNDEIRWTDRGPVLMLRRRYYRERFLINEFGPRDTDFLYEGDMAGSVHGVGLRSRVYWAWFLRRELMRWSLDAVERIGANGMLYGFHESGNAESAKEMLAALKAMRQYNIASFPVVPGTESMANRIASIQPTGVAHDVMLNFLHYFDDLIRLCFVGQTLSAQAGSTGLGSGVAELHEDTKNSILRSDAMNDAETIDADLLQPLIRNNRWWYRRGWIDGRQLPFQVHARYPLERDDVPERLQAAAAIAQLGGQVDVDDLRDQAGLKAPAQGAVVPGGATQVAMPGPGGAGAPLNPPVGGTQPGILKMPQPLPRDGDRDSHIYDSTPFETPTPQAQAAARSRYARGGSEPAADVAPFTGEDIPHIDFRPATPEEFVAARGSTTRPGFLTGHSVDELHASLGAGGKLFLSPDRTVGYHLDPAGDLQNAFNNGGPKRAGAAAVLHGISQGARTLDAFLPFLPRLYHHLGFRTSKIVRWNDEYAPPGWDYEAYGRPRVAFMEYPDDGARDPEELRRRVGTYGAFHDPEPDRPAGLAHVGVVRPAGAGSGSAEGQRVVGGTPAHGPGPARAPRKLLGRGRRHRYARNEDRRECFPMASRGQIVRYWQGPRRHYTLSDVLRVAQQLGIRWDRVRFGAEELQAGLNAEQEHEDVTGGDLLKVAKIALSHLTEIPDYYRRLRQMELAAGVIVRYAQSTGTDWTPEVEDTPPAAPAGPPSLLAPIAPPGQSAPATGGIGAPAVDPGSPPEPAAPVAAPPPGGPDTDPVKAPKFGMLIHGVFYKPGQEIPAEVIRKAQKQEVATLIYAQAGHHAPLKAYSDQQLKDLQRTLGGMDPNRDTRKQQALERKLAKAHPDWTETDVMMAARRQLNKEAESFDGMQAAMRSERKRRSEMAVSKPSRQAVRLRRPETVAQPFRATIKEVQGFQGHQFQPAEKGYDDTNEALKYGDKHWKDWGNGLSQTEADALKAYQYDQDINFGLRRANHPQAALLKDASYHRMVAAIDTALDRSVVPENVFAWRGAGYEDIFGNADPESLVGTVLHDRGIVSTALNPRVSDNFMKKATGRGIAGVLFRIKVPKGSKGGVPHARTDEFPSEVELTLPRNARFLIQAVRQKMTTGVWGASGALPYYEVEAAYLGSKPEPLREQPTTDSGRWQNIKTKAKATNVATKDAQLGQIPELSSDEIQESYTNHVGQHEDNHADFDHFWGDIQAASGLPSGAFYPLPAAKQLWKLFKNGASSAQINKQIDHLNAIIAEVVKPEK